MSLQENLTRHYSDVRKRLNPAPKPVVKPAEVRAFPVIEDRKALTAIHRRIVDVKSELEKLEARYVRAEAEALRPSVKKIKKEVARYFRKEIAELDGDQRNTDNIRPRHIAIFLCCKLTNKSTTYIGLMFGGRDHATVINARRKITKLIESDPQTAEIVETIRKRIVPC